MLANFFTLYNRALRESRHVTNFALLILLDEDVYTAQRKALTELVRTIDAKNAGELGMKINLATTPGSCGSLLLGTGKTMAHVITWSKYSEAGGELLDVVARIEFVVIAHPDGRVAGTGNGVPFRVRRMASSAPMHLRRAVSMVDRISA